MERFSSVVAKYQGSDCGWMIAGILDCLLGTNLIKEFGGVHQSGKVCSPKEIVL